MSEGQNHTSVGEKIWDAVENVSSLHHFVEGGAIDICLEQISEVELDAAHLALEMARLTRNWHQQMWLVIGHLQSAHTALSRRLDSQWLEVTDLIRWGKAHDKNIATLCLMALCYRYVGETEAMRATLKEVQKELSRVWRLKHHLQGDSFSDWISNDPIGTTKAWGALLVSVYRHLIREIIKHPIKTFSDELPEDTFDLSHFSVNDFCKRLEAL